MSIDVPPRDEHAAVTGAVRAHLRDCPHGLVLVAVSGGADSLALAHAAHQVAGDRQLGAILVDHALQPHSAEVIAAAAARCRDLGLAPVTIATIAVTDRRGGLEAGARRARYAAIDDVAHAGGAVAVLLGHTRDDQAETVLLGLLRGSGARTMSGMRAVDGIWRRPLLDIPRAATRAYCRAHGLAFHDDPMNADEHHVRVRLRRRVLPALRAHVGEGIVRGMARSAQLLREDDEALTLWALDARRAVTDPEDGSLKVQALCDLPRAVRSRILRTALIGAGCPAGALSRAHLDSVDDLLTAWHGQGPPALPGGVIVRRRSGRLLIIPAP